MDTPPFNPTNFNRRKEDMFAGEITSTLMAIPEEMEVDVALERRVEL
jgi:hypothetical protein